MEKNKKASASGLPNCSNCGIFEGEDVTLSSCSKCGSVQYCGKPCQRKHWKDGHKKFCFSPEERKPDAVAASASQTNVSEVSSSGGGGECAICLSDLENTTSTILPCSHIYHTACISELRKFGVAQTCPLCRSELPPEEERFDAALRRYHVIEIKVKRGLASWGALSKADKKEMASVVLSMRSAAEKGNRYAQYHFGSFFDKGQGVAQDSKQAAKWIKASAEQGFSDAQYTLGNKYQCGLERDFAKAVEWYQKAVAQGNGMAMTNLGLLYTKGLGTKQDHGKATELFKQAVLKGVPEAMCNLFNKHFKCAENGGIDQNIDEAEHLALLACKKGCPEAALMLGKFYRHGAHGIPRSFSKAESWLKAAAASDCNDVQAARELGLFYWKGCADGVGKNFQAASKWFTVAVEAGDLKAMYYFGNFFMFEENKEAVAARWFHLASSKGQAESQLMLGQIYEQGSCGYPQDHAKALEFITLSADQGVAPAKEHLERLTLAQDPATAGRLINARVELYGSHSAAHFNSEPGVVASYSRKTGLFCVALDSGRKVRVTAHNFRRPEACNDIQLK